MVRNISFILLLFISLGCQQKGIVKIDASKLKLLKAEGVEVIDIRTPGEYEQGHIPDVKLIDFKADDFMDKMNELDKSKPIIIHCASGNRSGRASTMLLDAGFIAVFDYSGGFSDWKSRGEEIEK